MSASRVLAVAASQKGTGESPLFSNHNKYTVWYNQHVARIGDGSWCDMFVAWVGDQAGESAAIGRFAYCPAHVTWFRNRGRWGHTPRAGAVVFFDWNGNGLADHVGFVLSVHSGYILTIEGNSGTAGGGTVREVHRSGYILGYGYPAYSAAPKPVPKPVPKPGPKPKPVPKPRKPALRRVLRYVSPRMTGADVKYVQQQLTRRGYHLVADGVYGAATSAAVAHFQAKSGLKNDGEVGKLTYAKL